MYNVIRSDDMRIGVFDSGIGGLTVLKELINKYPNNHYIYYGDTLHLPYGVKTKDELRGYTDKIIHFFIEQKVELIIIACGTVSSNLYDEIKDKYGIFIIDVLNPTAAYIKKNNLTNIGVLATPMTIKSKAFSKKIDMPVKAISCPLFVPLIENGNVHSKECEEAVKTYLNNLGQCDNIILGCTHYPVLKEIILKHTEANLIDMGKCVCDYIDIKSEEGKEVSLYFSLLSKTLVKNVSMIMEDDYEIILKEL